MDRSFAERLRQQAIHGVGYATLVDTVARLVGAVSLAANQGLWNVSMTFDGMWHGDHGARALVLWGEAFFSFLPASRRACG